MPVFHCVRCDVEHERPVGRNCEREIDADRLEEGTENPGDEDGETEEENNDNNGRETAGGEDEGHGDGEPEGQVTVTLSLAEWRELLQQPSTSEQSCMQLGEKRLRKRKAKPSKKKKKSYKNNSSSEEDSSSESEDSSSESDETSSSESSESDESSLSETSSSEDEDRSSSKRKSKKRRKKSLKKKKEAKKIKKAAAKMLKKKRARKSGLCRGQKDNKIEVYFQWPHEYVSDEDGNQPTWKDLGDSELFLGLGRMRRNLRKLKKKSAAKVVAELTEIALKEMPRVGLETVKRMFTKVFQAIERGELSWDKHKSIMALKEGILLREDRTHREPGQAKDSRIVVAKPPKATAERSWLFCEKFNRGECPIESVVHYEGNQKYKHLCTYCVKHGYNRDSHSVLECRKKKRAEAAAAGAASVPKAE